MRDLSLFLTLLGISLIFLHILIYPPIPSSSQNQINSMLSNQKVSFSGEVIKQTYQASYIIFSLDNNLSVYCYYCTNLPKLEGKFISGTGIIDTYQKNKIKVIKLNWKN